MTPSWPWLVIGIERDVGHHAEFRENASSAPRPRAAPGPRDRAAARPSTVFSDGSMTGNNASAGMPSARHPRRPEAADRPSSARRRASTPPPVVCADSVEHEHRIDQVVGVQHVLADQAAREVVAAQPAHAQRWKVLDESGRWCSCRPHCLRFLGTLRQRALLVAVRGLGGSRLVRARGCCEPLADELACFLEPDLPGCRKRCRVIGFGICGAGRVRPRAARRVARCLARACRTWSAAPATAHRAASNSSSVRSRSVSPRRMSSTSTTPASARRCAQVSTGELVPGSLDLDRRGREAVAGRVDDERLRRVARAEREVVQRLGAAGRLAGERQALLLADHVDRRRLAGVRAADEGHLGGRAVSGNWTQLGDGGRESSGQQD